MAHGDSSTTNSTTATTGKTTTKTVSPAKLYQSAFPLYHWYMVAAICAVFALFHFGSMLAHRQRRLAAIKARSLAPVSEKDDFAVKSAPSGGGLLAAPLAVKAALWKGLIWREFAVSMWSTSSSELFWSVGYTVAMLVFGFVYLPMGPTDTPKTQASMYANRCGRLAFAQLPLIVGLASKNNVITFVTGVSYEKLNFLHRSSARACLILSWAHSIGRSVPIPLQTKNSLQHVHMQMGVVALASFTLLTLLSFKPFLRRMAYEAFLISHILLALLFIVGCYMHWQEFGFWVWPSLFLWGLDRFVRLGKTIVLNKLWLSFSSKTGVEQRTAVVESLHGGALRVTLPRSMNWTPGQHAYLVCPTVSRFPFEAHPFTIASIPSSDKKVLSDVTFLVGANDGFTGRLSKMAKSHGGRLEIPAYLDGPYGTIESLDSFSSVVLIAGGTGVTYTLPLALQLVRQAQAGTSAVSTLTFVWVVRNVEHIAWISSTLNQLRHDCPPLLVLDIKIFVTQALVNDLPSGSSTIASTSSNDHETSSSNEEITSDEDRSSSPDSSELNEKMQVAERDAEKLGAELDHTGGRPDFSTLLGHIIKDAAGGAVAVNVCGPSSLSSSVRSALNSSDGPYKIKDVWNGGSSVSLHTESFGW